MAKIAVTSDLHGILPEVEECDILLICGDIIPLWCQSNMIASEEWFQTKFFPWCRDCSAKNVVFIAGNHDHFLARKLAWSLEMLRPWRAQGVYYLKNDFIELEGLKIFGTPYCKIFGNWAFMREPERLKQYYSEIPKDLDILISHDCPYGVHDIIVEDSPWANGEHIGNPQLLDAIKDKQPKYHFSGHLHGTSHEPENIDNTISYSVSLVNEKYRAVYPILYLNI